MNNYLLKKIIISFLYIALAIVIECFMFSCLDWGLFPEYYMYDLSIMMLIGFLIFACRTMKGSYVLTCIFIGLQIGVSYTNICVYATLNDVFSVNMLALVGETAEVLTPDLFPWIPLLFFATIVAILIVSIVFMRRIPVEKGDAQKFSKMFFRVVAVIGVTVSLSLYSIQTLTLKSTKDKNLYLLGDDYLFNTFSSSKLSLQKFGTYAFYIEDTARMFVKPTNLKEIDKFDVSKYLASAEYDPTTASSLYGALLDSNGDPNGNVFVIMAESFEWYAISEEVTPLLYALANGYNITSGSDSLVYKLYDFDYADRDAGDVIALRKGFDRIVDANGNISYTKNSSYENAYDETEESSYGLTFLNYYSKAKTDYSETSVILGSYPYNESFTVRGGVTGFSAKKLYNNINYSATLPNVLKDSGYIERGKASYFHTFESQFYGRDTLIPKYGFDSTTFYDTFSNNSNILTGDRLAHSILDSEVMAEYSNNFLHLDNNGNLTTTKPWLTWLTTVTTHGEYTTENYLLKEHYAFIDSPDVNFLLKSPNPNLVKDSSVEGQVRTYLAGALDTEWMIAILLDKLIQSNQLDNTTLLFYADHQAYYTGLDLSYKAYYYADTAEDYGDFRAVYYDNSDTTGDYSNFSSERYAVPSFIWSKALTKDNCGIIVDDNGNAILDSGGNEQKIQYIEKFMIAFDLTPTILTLCGINYNTHYYLGYPAIAYDEDGNELKTNVLISHTGGYFNNRIFSEDGIKISYSVSGISESEKKQFSYNIIDYLERWYLLSALYKYDMFEKVALQF